MHILKVIIFVENIIPWIQQQTYQITQPLFHPQFLFDNTGNMSKSNEPSVFEKQQSRDEIGNLSTQVTFNENPMPTLFNIEEKCHIFSSKRIINPLSALSVTTEASFQKLEQQIQKMEENLHHSERMYQRKLNGLISKLEKENEREENLTIQLQALKQQLSDNIHLIQQLQQQVHCENRSGQPEYHRSGRPNRKRTPFLSIKAAINPIEKYKL